MQPHQASATTATLTPSSDDTGATINPIPNAAHDGAERDDGRLRAEADNAAAIAAGFTPRQPMFDRGTAIDSSHAGSAARRSRIAFDAQPTVTECCEAFMTRITNERRHDVEVKATDLRLSKDGSLAMRRERKRFALSPHAFKTLVTRTGIGGAGYLSKCWPELRAHNFNQWMTRIFDEEQEKRAASVAAQALNPKIKLFESRQLVLRTRDNANSVAREVFGVVTPSYTTFDVDRIAQALALAAPEEARGAVSYNGRGARFDVLFRTTRQPDEFVSGEFFRAGAAIRTDDTGSGSILIRAFVNQHLCNNMIMIDRCAKDVIRLQHRGSVDQLAARFRNGFDLALQKLDHFLVAWDYAKEEDVIARSQATTTDTIPTTVDEALPGFFNGILDRELVPVRGKAKQVVPVLVEMWREDTSSDAGRCSRAAIVNAFTRYAHVIESNDRTDEIQTAASQLLFGSGERHPNPLPYLALAA